MDDLNTLICGPPPSVKTIEIEVPSTSSLSGDSSPGVEKHFCAVSNCTLCPLQPWLHQHVDAWKPGSIFISGSGRLFPPGTGKRATLAQLVRGEEGYFPLRRLPIFVDCMVVKSWGTFLGKDILCQVARKLHPGYAPTTILEAIENINEAVDRSNEMLVLLLDNADQMEDKDVKVLNRAMKCIFTNRAEPPTKMVKVADLAPPPPPKPTPPAERKRTLTPPIERSGVTADQAELATAKEAMLGDPEPHDQPCTRVQLMSLITSRLEGRGVGHVFSQGGIKYAAMKMAKVSGDARLTLDMMRRALDIALAKARDAQGSSPTLTIPQLHSGDMWRLLDPRGRDYASGLGIIGVHTPQEQKILLATLLLMVKHRSCKEVTMGKLIDTYKKVMKKRSMKAEPDASCVGM